MPRKSARENGGFRRTGWKAKLAKREADEKRIVKNIYIGASNARRWIILKKKLEYRSDVDFVAYLLNLAEPFSGKGKLERKDKEDNDGKNNPIPKVPDISVEGEANAESLSQEKGVERVEFNEVEGEVEASGEVKVVEEEEEQHVIDEEGGGEGDNEEEEEDEEDDEEEDDDDDEGSGGEWTAGRQPLRRSLRSLPTNKGAKMSVRRSARNVRREEEEDEEDEEEEEGEEERGEGAGGELAGLKRRKRGDRSQRRQRRRERKKRRRRKRLKGSGGESTEEDEDDSEVESEGEAGLLRGEEEEEEGLRSEEGVMEVASAPAGEEHSVIEQVDAAPTIAEAPKKGRRGRKKKVVVPEAEIGEEIAEKVEGEPDVGVAMVMVEAPPVDPIVNAPRVADSVTHIEEPAGVIDPESDRVSKHHRHHRRKSRKSKDGMDEDGIEDEAEGEEEGGEMGEVGTGRKKKRRKRGRARREEECGGEEGEVMAEDQGEENFPRYEVVEGVAEDGDVNHQDKTPLPIQSISQEEGVLIEVGERVKLKRRRKRRHSRGEEGEGGENEGMNGDAASSEDPLNVIRKTLKHKKRKHGHGEGHGNRRKHHDVRKVPVDGVLSEPSPVPAPALHPEGSQEATGSIPDPSTPTTPTSSTTPPTAVSKGGDNKQRVAIRITLCGECDSRHVLDACPLKRPLTIIHDTVVLRNSVGDEQNKDEVAEGVSLGDADAKSFATEEEEELADGEETQDTLCKKKKKANEDDDAEDAAIPAGGVKDPDERRRQRNGLSEGIEDRMPVPNGKYRPGTERISTIAQDTVKPVEGENGDDSMVEGKGVKDESGADENKLESQEEMLANGDASTTSNSTSASKPMNVDADDLESANETCTSQPSPMPVQEPVSTADTSVGNGNSANGGKTFAEASLPMALKLETREAGHGPGVTARRPIARFTQFGPLLGRRIREMDIPDDFGMRHIWEVIGASGRFLISTEDPTTSNWLRFIRPAPTREQRNVAPVTRGDRLYFVTTAPLQVGEELLYWPDESSGSGGAPAGTPQPSSAQGPNSSSNTSSSSTSSSGAGWAKKKMEKTNCGGCNLRFGHPLYYRLHCSVFHDPNFSLTIRKYHCKVCGAAVLGKENIMRHAAENHDGKGAYQCQFCKKFFLRLNYLEMHRTYGCAANPQRTRPLCDFCGRKFCQPQKLKVHIKRMHSDMADVLREFQCKLCLKLLGSRAALQRHMKEVHHRDVVGACACDRCGKTFQNKSNLKIHMLTHSGVKPFRCREGNCPAAFTTKQCLQFHYKKVHGYGEDNMPVIERCVAYTFDAYSGGTVEDPGRGKVPLFSSNRLEKEQDDSNASNPAPDSEAGEDESESIEGRSLSPQRGRKEQGEGRREKAGSKGRGRRPGRPVGRTNGPREVKEGMQPKPALDGDGLVEAMVPSVIPEEILPPSDADVLPPPPPVIPSLPEAPECKEAILGNMADSQPPPLTPQPGPLPTEVAPQTPTLEAYNGGQSALGAPGQSIASYADHSRVPYPGKVVSKGSKKWMGDGSVPMRPTLEAEIEEEDEEDDEEEDEEEEDDEGVGVGKRVGEEGVVGEGQVVGDVYGSFPDDSRFVPVTEDGEEGFRRPEESNASLLVEAALDAAERDMSGVAVQEDESKPHQESEGGGGYLTSPPRVNGPDRHMDEDDHQRILHHPQPSHHAHHHLQHHHHLSLHHHQLSHPHHPHHPHVHHHLPPASHLHVQGGALMLHHPHHHHPTHHTVMHQEEDEEEERMGPGSEAANVGTLVERIVNTSLAEEEEADGRDDVPHPGVRGMHLLHPDAYAPDPHGRLPPAGSLPSPRNMTLLGMKAAVKVEEELHMAAMQQQQQREEEEEGLDMSYKHSTGHYGRAVSSMTHHMQEEEEGTQGVGGVGDPSADDLQDFRVLRSPPVEGRFEQSQQGLDMSRGSFPFALPAARCFPLYEGSTSAADVARSVDLRRAGLAYTSPPLPPYSQSLDLTPMRTRHSVDLSLPRSLVGAEGVGPPQGGGGQSPPPPPSPMHRHLCHAPPASPHHHVHHHHGVDALGCVVGGDDGGEGGSGGLSPPPAAYQPGAYLHAPPSYHRQPPQHPPSPPPSPYHPQARTAPHMPPPPSASPSPYHHYSGYY